MEHSVLPAAPAVKKRRIPWRPLSGNALKLIAAAAMVADHTGLLFFPSVPWLRTLGRLAFPIFAFMIGEGCKYTKSRPRYLGTILLLAALCQTVYYLFSRSTYLCVLVTFSLAIAMVYALQFLRESWLRRGSALWRKILSPVLLCGLAAAVWRLNQVLTIDYGFWGCMLPVFSGALRQRAGQVPDALTKLDKHWVHVLMLGLGTLLLALDLGGLQIYSLLSLPLVLLYSGKRGRWKLKYFFYIFYPAHLALLQGLWMLLLG